MPTDPQGVHVCDGRCNIFCDKSTAAPSVRRAQIPAEANQAAWTAYWRTIGGFHNGTPRDAVDAALAAAAPVLLSEKDAEIVELRTALVECERQYQEKVAQVWQGMNQTEAVEERLSEYQQRTEAALAIEPLDEFDAEDKAALAFIHGYNEARRDLRAALGSTNPTSATEAGRTK